MKRLTVEPRDLVMEPSDTPGYFVRGSVVDDHPMRSFCLPWDGPILHAADELEADGWRREGERWVKWPA